MSRKRLYGKFVSQRHMERREAIHGELRAEFKPVCVQNEPFPIAMFIAGLTAISTLIVMVAT